MAILLIRKLLKEGKISEAFEIIEGLDEESHFNEISLYKCVILELQGKYKESLEIVNKILHKLSTDRDQEDGSFKFKVLTCRAYCLWRLSQYSDAFESAKQAEQLQSAIDFYQDEILSEWEGRLHNYYGIHYWNSGDLNYGLEKFQFALKCFEEIGHTLFKTFTNYNIGLIYWSQGDLASAISKLSDSLRLFELMNNDQYVGTCYMQLSSLYVHTGELNKALFLSNKGLDIAKRLENYHDIALNLNNLGTIYFRKSESDIALDYYLQALQLSKENNISQDIARSLNNIAVLKWQDGQIKESIKYHTETLSLRRKLEIETDLCNSLYNLILLHVDEGNLETAKDYLEELQDFSKKSQVKRVRFFYKLAFAYYLKHYNRLREKIKSMDLFYEVINGELIDHALSTFALLNICDLLIIEYKLSRNLETLEDIKKLIAKLIKTSKEIGNRALAIEIQLLEIKLALAELDLGKAKNLMSVILLTIEDSDNLPLSLKMHNHLDEIIEQIRFYESFNINNNEIENSVLLNNLHVSLQSLLRKSNGDQRKPVSEYPIGLIILNDKKKILIEKNFNQDSDFFETEDVKKAQELITSKQEISKIEILGIDKQKFALVKKTELIYCYIYQGSSFAANQKLSSFIQLFESFTSDYQKLLNETFDNNLPQNFENLIKIIFVDLNYSGEIISDESESISIGPKNYTDKLERFKILLHPLRLTIVKLLNQYYFIKRSVTMKILNINSGTLDRELKILENGGVLISKMILIDTNPTKTLYFTEKGQTLFNEFKEVMKI